MIYINLEGRKGKTQCQAKSVCPIALQCGELGRKGDKNILI